MTEPERAQILKMINDGKISAEEGLRLMRAIDEAATEDEIEVIEPEISSGTGTGSGFSSEPDPEVVRMTSRVRSFWEIPLAVGVLITVLTAYWLYTLVSASNFGFWFYCAWLPFLIGIAVIALGAGWQKARWLFVRVEQKPGERPQRIVFGFPIPFRFMGWFTRTFGHRIRGLDKTNLDEILEAFDQTTTSDTPLVINVDEGDDGERVQVFIG
jgi:hypothetical protein